MVQENRIVCAATGHISGIRTGYRALRLETPYYDIGKVLCNETGIPFAVPNHPNSHSDIQSPTSVRLNQPAKHSQAVRVGG